MAQGHHYLKVSDNDIEAAVQQAMLAAVFVYSFSVSMFSDPKFGFQA